MKKENIIYPNLAIHVPLYLIQQDQKDFKNQIVIIFIPTYILLTDHKYVPGPGNYKVDNTGI